jgi:hypothetical protein
LGKLDIVSCAFFFSLNNFFFCESMSPVISTLILCRFQQELLHEPQQTSDWLELILSQEQQN